MSIIYDALQKTQRNREYLKQQNGIALPVAQRRNLKWMAATGLILVVSAGIGALITFYWHPVKTVALSNTSKAKQSAAEKLVPALESANFWLSDSQKAAPNTQTTPLAAPVKIASVASMPLPASQAAVPQPVPNTMVNGRLLLNGVMISGSDRIALINNQSFQVGDIVNGMKIVSIEADSVKLQRGQQLAELRISV